MICPSVRPPRCGIVSKRLNMSTKGGVSAPKLRGTALRTPGACPGFFIGAAKIEWPKAESGVGGGAATPSLQLGGLGSAVSSPSGVRSRSPTAQKALHYFQHSVGLY